MSDKFTVEDLVKEAHAPLATQAFHPDTGVAVLGQGDAANITESQTTTLHATKEVSPEVLANTPVWRQVIPNSYSTFGSTVSTIETAEIEPSKQDTKGPLSQVTAAAGFEFDLKNGRMREFLPGLFSAAYTQRAATNRVDAAATDASVVAVVADGYTTTNTTSANGWAIASDTNTLVVAKGFANKANNGLKEVTAITATKVSVAGLVAEASPPANAYLALVGIKLTSGSTSFDNATKTITFDKGLGTLGLQKHDWIQYTHNDVLIGQGRVESSTSTTVKLDIVAWADKDGNAANLSSSNKGELLVASRYINNPTPATLVESTYQFEQKVSDGNVRRVTGGIFNTLALNFAALDKITAQLDFVSQDEIISDAAYAGTRRDEFFETIYNTSSDIRHIVLVDDKSQQLVAFLQSVTFNVDKGVTPQNVLGRATSVGGTSASFVLSVTAEALFNGFGASRAARGNKNVSMYIFVRNNDGGFVLDMPLLTIGEASTNITRGEPVTITMNNKAYKGSDGYTLRWSQFEYLR